MSQQTIWGRRNPKIEGSHWEQLDLSCYKITKPIVICLSGNATIDEKEANGFCKTAENLMGLKLSSGNPEDIYEYADLIGVSYANREGSDTGELTEEDVANIVDNVLLPLCVDKEGFALPIDQICKNLSAVTFFSFCLGDSQVYKICNNLNGRLIKDLGFTGEETDIILGAMMNVCYSPYSHNTSLTPRVFAMSEKDKTNATAIIERDIEFVDNEIVTKIHNPFYRVYFPEIGIYTQELSPKYENEHGVNIIQRDSNWRSVEDAKNADCVSQMMGYALARSVANSINNFNSDTYIPKIPMEQLLSELKDIQQSFENENERER